MTKLISTVKIPFDIKQGKQPSPSMSNLIFNLGLVFYDGSAGNTKYTLEEVLNEFKTRLARIRADKVIGKLYISVKASTGGGLLQGAPAVQLLRIIHNMTSDPDQEEGSDYGLEHLLRNDEDDFKNYNFMGAGKIVGGPIAVSDTDYWYLYEIDFNASDLTKGSEGEVGWSEKDPISTDNDRTAFMIKVNHYNFIDEVYVVGSGQIEYSPIAGSRYT